MSGEAFPVIGLTIPFDGNKMSGWGREFGKEGLEPYLKTKATTVIFANPPF